MMAAPASAAPIAASAISVGVIGRWGDMVGVWIAPVIAQVMMTLLDAAMNDFPRPSAGQHRLPPARFVIAAEHDVAPAAVKAVRGVLWGAPLAMLETVIFQVISMIRG